MAPQLLGHCAAAAILARPIRLLAFGTVPQKQQPALLLVYMFLALLDRHWLPLQAIANWGHDCTTTTMAGHAIHLCTCRGPQAQLTLCHSQTTSQTGFGPQYPATALCHKFDNSPS